MRSRKVALRRRVCALAVLVGLVLAGCTERPPTTVPVLPPVGGGLDYQLGGAYEPPAGVDIVVRDSTDEPAAALYSVCYLNGFQTQPADSRRMLEDSPELILSTGDGPVHDENWPDELLFDTGSAGTRSALAAVLLPRLEGCAAAGFDAVELDNLDSYTRSAGLLTADDNIEFARILVTAAHELGLAIGQKNAADLAATLAGLFDFAIAEECDRWQDCGLYRAAYGDRVLAIEYADDLREDFAAACAVPGRPRSMILRDRDLAVVGAADYVYERC